MTASACPQSPLQVPSEPEVGLDRQAEVVSGPHFRSALPIPEVGSLSRHLQAWQDMGATPWTLKVLRAGFRLVWGPQKPPLTKHPVHFPPPILTSAKEVIDQEVVTLELKKAISRVTDQESPGFYCRLFAVQKATGGFRPVLDLSKLNEFLRHIQFRMDTTSLVRQSMLPGDWSVSVNLIDAFFHVPIHPRDRKWLRFVWNNQVFQFNVLPFGLSQSPWVFTRVVRELIKWAHVQGIRMLSHMDDWLILSHSRALCASQLNQVVSQACLLGFQIHPDKSEFTPQQTFIYLGIQFNTLAWSVQPAPKRVSALLQKVQTLCARQSAISRQIASILGAMESMASLLPLARVHKRPLQRELNMRFSQSRESWNKRIWLQDWFTQSVQQWLDLSWIHLSVPLTLPKPSHEIFVDASQKGWGAHSSSLTANALWSEPEVGSHINYLELRAVTKALEAFQPHLQKGHILIWSDNKTVVALIKHQGGTHSPLLSQEAEALLKWAYSLGWILSAKHVKGSCNVMADLLSRPDSILPTEWTLSLSVLHPIWQKWGKPLLDLFATKYSARLPVYVSPVPDDHAWEVDALSFSWTGLDAYAFPPFKLIPEVLQKVITDQPRLILIAPLWPSMIWFNMLHDMAHEPPIPLIVGEAGIAQPRSGIVHGNPMALNLHAFLLCGAHCKDRDCQRKL